MAATEQAITLTKVAAEAAENKLGKKLIAHDVSEQLAITDVFLLVSASNERQVSAIVDEIELQLREQCQVKPVRREGDRENRWVLLDYIDLVVHIQHEEERGFYALERLWKDTPRIELGMTEEVPMPEHAPAAELEGRAGA
ncbi:ribosome silencing factor [Granulicoccus phenolivorans]|uniref:ribosome silencing factor n=1 Tax=Granulicoccus phenolivorans TaxID=266854 RepID=UPI00041ABE47|nr:ribosome silencing factor [Granulicoccus phenolivorans]